MVEPLPKLSSSSKGDKERDIKETPEKGKRGLSLSQCIVREMQLEPDRPFVVRDLVDRTGGNYHSVKRELARISSMGKGSGPVRRVRHGMYQYAPEKEQDSLRALARSGNWKVENLTFVSLRAHPTPVSLSETVPQQAKGTPDSSQPTPHAGYPWKLDTGQLVSWDDYQNGTQLIRISANGAPPISPDHAITIISSLKNFGLDDSWICKSIEVNVDSYRHRIDSNYSLQTIEGLLLKAYQHGYSTRVEIADRRDVSVREVLELFHSIAGGIEGKETTRKVTALEARVQQAEKNSRLAYNIANGLRDEHIEAKRSKQKAPQPEQSGFTTAAKLRKQD